MLALWRATFRIAVLAMLAVPAPAAAFDSLPPGSSPHDGITKEGAGMAGWDGDTKALRAAVREPDLEDSELDPDSDTLARVDATESYRPFHHCDRVPGQGDVDAFRDTVGYIRAEREAALNASAQGKEGKAMEHLGRALHALQDCLSHSNAVDLPAAAQRVLVDVLANASADADPPGGLRITSYQPGIEDPERPPGDDYTHAGFAKDSPDKNGESEERLQDGRTKHEAARGLAANATAGFLRGVQAELPPRAWADLQKADPDRVPEAWPIPEAGAWPLALAALGLALLRRGR